LTITLYGIRNCDTMKRARAWLDTHQVDYVFHDYKVAGIDRATLERWQREVGLDRLLNRSGTTFRKLDEALRQSLDDAGAVALMVAQPSMIRRPVLETGSGIVVGFDPGVYAARLRPRG
jgi:arsenate reductase (glutaredoxin)